MPNISRPNVIFSAYNVAISRCRYIREYMKIYWKGLTKRNRNMCANTLIIIVDFAVVRFTLS